MSDPIIDKVFDQLDQWRHLPKYQLERRADIYFAMFLPIVLQKHFNTEFKNTIIPEFPLKKDNYQSQNADYFALSADCKRALLVELKTDVGSLDDDQFDYYLRRRRRQENGKILDELKSIVTCRPAGRISIGRAEPLEVSLLVGGTGWTGAH